MKKDCLHRGKQSFFVLFFYTGGEDMNITKFIRNHKELNNMPFMVVFTTIWFLQKQGMLNVD